MPMIEVDHLTKYFGPVPAVVDVSLNIPLYKEIRTEAYLRFVAEVKGVPARERQREVGRRRITK